jgi:ferric enterobactin receptor
MFPSRHPRSGGALLLALCLAPIAAAQMPVPPRSTDAIGEVRGRLVDSTTTAAITGGSVTLRRAGDSSFAGGALPGPDGSFRINGLRPGRYTLRVRALGFSVALRPSIDITAAAPMVDVGAINLSPVGARIAGQVITAEQDEVTLAPDRNSYSTRNMATASGGTAVDVLRNVPSVAVDGSNRLSLRGNDNVVVQINGRSSPLRGEQLGNFLAQLPASTIARIEVVTNPSARDDPEGTAGIINILLNQRADLHLSGGATASTATSGLVNLSGNLGQRHGPWTLFGSYSFFRDNRIVSGHRDVTNLLVADPPFVVSRSNASSSPRSHTLTLRSEFRPDARNVFFADVIVLQSDFARANESNYFDLDASRDVVGAFDRFSAQRARSFLQDYALAYHRGGNGRASGLSTELHMTRVNSSTGSDLFGLVRQPDSSTGAASTPRERDLSSTQYPTWTAQADYTHSVGAHVKLESGLKALLRNTNDDFAAAYLDSLTGTFLDIPGRATAAEYRERIGAGYLVMSQQLGKLQTQAGVRLERAATQFLAKGTSEPYDSRYASAFPSAIVAYGSSSARQARLSYSRRITRPDPSQLNPVTYREDPTHSFSGNPRLQPEYTNAFELTLQQTAGWGSIQLSPYLRRATHAVRFIQRIDATGEIKGTYDNVASTENVGADLNMTVRRGPLSLLTGGSAFRYRSDAANLGGDPSVHTFSWSTRANATWKFTSLTDAQLFATYQSRFGIEGGSQAANVFLNVAIRRKLWSEQGSATLRVNDPFNMTSFGFVTGDDRVLEVSRRRFGRVVSIAISRSFGQQLKLRPRQDPDVPTPPPTVH